MARVRGAKLDELPDDSRRICQAWNRSIPSRSICRFSLYRQNEMRCVLMDFTADEVIAVIEWYAARRWNRTNQKWKTFDHFLNAQAITWLYEEREREQTKREAAADRRRRADADKAAEDAEWLIRRQAKAAMLALPPAAQAALRQRAETELGAGLDKLRPMVEAKMIDMFMSKAACV